LITLLKANKPVEDNLNHNFKGMNNQNKQSVIQ